MGYVVCAGFAELREMKKLPRFRAWLGRDYLRGDGWAGGFCLFPKPVQVVGDLCRCFLGCWIRIRPGKIVRRYDRPRFAGYWGSFNSARWTGRDWKIHRIDWPTIKIEFWR